MQCADEPTSSDSKIITEGKIEFLPITVIKWAQKGPVSYKCEICLQKFAINPQTLPLPLNIFEV
jgi:hypothetical protein